MKKIKKTVFYITSALHTPGTTFKIFIYHFKTTAYEKVNYHFDHFI